MGRIRQLRTHMRTDDVQVDTLAGFARQKKGTHREREADREADSTAHSDK